MGTFDLNKQSSKDETQQMSFDQLDNIAFNASQLDFSTDGSTAKNKDYSYQLVDLEPESKTGRFISLSILLHASLVLIASLIAIPMIDQSKVETITIEVQDSKLESAQAAATVAKPMAPQMAAPEAQVPASAMLPEPTATVAAPVHVKKAAAIPVHKASHPVAVKKPAQAHHQAAQQAKAVHVAKASATPMATESPVVIPQSLDDISTPDLDESSVKNSQAVAMDEKDLSEDLNKVDDQHRKLVAVEQKRLQDEADQAEQENAALLAETEKENQNEKARIAAINQARRNADAKAIAAAQASERAGQEKAARDATAASASASAMAAKNAAQNGNGDGVGEAESASVGTPQGEVRQLEDLKQMPGNRKPMYDVNERLKGHQGTAIFMAYISKEGHTGQFKLVQSSGYRNLDSKTLSALKQWRFYPGQEGWVEMPIQWDLKGGAQEKPTLLRRSAN